MSGVNDVCTRVFTEHDQGDGLRPREKHLLQAIAPPQEFFRNAQEWQ